MITVCSIHSLYIYFFISLFVSSFFSCDLCLYFITGTEIFLFLLLSIYLQLMILKVVSILKMKDGSLLHLVIR